MSNRTDELKRARELLARFRARMNRLHGPARIHPHTQDIASRTRSRTEEFRLDDAASGGHRLDQSMLVPAA